jgi:hypothetical protein
LNKKKGTTSHGALPIRKREDIRDWWKVPYGRDVRKIYEEGLRMKGGWDGKRWCGARYSRVVQWCCGWYSRIVV